MQSNRIVFQALDGAEKAASNEPFETLYEDLVIHLDELLDSQLTALVEAVRAVQVEREAEKILAEAV